MNPNNAPVPRGLPPPYSPPQQPQPVLMASAPQPGGLTSPQMMMAPAPTPVPSPMHRPGVTPPPPYHGTAHLQQSPVVPMAMPPQPSPMSTPNQSFGTMMMPQPVFTTAPPQQGVQGLPPGYILVQQPGTGVLQLVQQSPSAPVFVMQQPQQPSPTGSIPVRTPGAASSPSHSVGVNDSPSKVSPPGAAAVGDSNSPATAPHMLGGQFVTMLHGGLAAGNSTGTSPIASQKPQKPTADHFPGAPQPFLQAQ